VDKALQNLYRERRMLQRNMNRSQQEGRKNMPAERLHRPHPHPSFWALAARGLSAVSLALACSGGQAQTAAPAVAAALPALSLAPGAVTVSGLSSGGYMAEQFEVAFSKSVSGAAIIAGGPYGCSLGSVTTAALTCSCPYDISDNSGPTGGTTAVSRMMCLHLPPRVMSSRSLTAVKGNKDHIDAIGNLQQHRVWLYSGDDDPVVDPTIVDGLQQFYVDAKVAKSRVKRVKGPRAGHGMPLSTAGNCEVTKSPYLNGCKIDGAGELLKWLYQKPALTPGEAQKAALRPFDQTPYRQAGVFDSLDDAGWVYVPKACEQKDAHCKLHVAFHGCEQGQSFPTDGQPYGTLFVEQAGYNRWAESMGVVILYPQVKPSNKLNLGSPYEFNPKGCWDFWGYTSPKGDASLFSTSPPFARRDAPQLRAVKAMVDALLATPTP
jgi:poly(3-hydroxybutyrate) depolymerase